LLLATEPHLSAETVLCLYARRWGIEPLFHNLKRWWEHLHHERQPGFL